MGAPQPLPSAALPPRPRRIPLAEPVASQQVPLRLSDGPHRCAGRVEVFYENRWGTVCDDHWDLQDAGVVCRQLGCGTALSARTAGHFRPGTGPIWMDDVNCTGTEVALSHCGTKGWGRNNCNHGEDAGVECSGAALYLGWLPPPGLSEAGCRGGSLVATN